MYCPEKMDRWCNWKFSIYRDHSEYSERRRYYMMLFRISWAYAQNDPWYVHMASCSGTAINMRSMKNSVTVLFLSTQSCYDNINRFLHVTATRDIINIWEPTKNSSLCRINNLFTKHWSKHCQGQYSPGIGNLVRGPKRYKLKLRLTLCKPWYNYLKRPLSYFT